LNVSPTWAVPESTESIIRIETSVPDGMCTSRGASGGAGSGASFVSLDGGTGGTAGGAIGVGSVNVPGAAVDAETGAVLEFDDESAGEATVEATAAGLTALDADGRGLSLSAGFGFAGTGS
jgi:hypothetical protein